VLLLRISPEEPLRSQEDQDSDQELCQNDGMWCFLNNLRQSFQTRIRNLSFDLLLGLLGGRQTVYRKLSSSASMVFLPSNYMNL